MKTNFLIFCFALITHVTMSQPQNTPTRYGIDVNFGVPYGLKTGDAAPDFSTMDANDRLVTLTKELKNGPVVIIFYRGEWCPVCNRYLSNFQDSLSYVIGAGAKVLAITPEKPSSARKMIEKTNATFTVIPDPTEEIMQSYDVMFNATEAYQDRIMTKLETDIASNNDNKEAKLPVPATFIINQDGIIVYRQFDLDYHIRATVKDILDNIPEQ